MVNLINYGGSEICWHWGCW